MQIINRAAMLILLLLLSASALPWSRVRKVQKWPQTSRWQQAASSDSALDIGCYGALNLTSIGPEEGSRWGVLSVSGPDRLAFLHGMATGDFESASNGAYVRTNFLDNKGRLVSHNLCFVSEN
jgi:hypothetical protein